MTHLNSCRREDLLIASSLLPGHITGLNRRQSNYQRDSRVPLLSNRLFNMIITGRSESQLALRELIRTDQQHLFHLHEDLLKAGLWNRQHSTLVTETMGAVWTLLMCLLAVWLAKGFYSSIYCFKLVFK